MPTTSISVMLDPSTSTRSWIISSTGILRIRICDRSRLRIGSRSPTAAHIMNSAHALPPDIQECVARALAEDVGTGDLTASLIPAEKQARAHVITREDAILAGTAWFDEVFRQLDREIRVRWLTEDGNRIVSNQRLCEIAGPARSILTGERTALNFLQLLSATATTTRHYVDAIAGTQCRILDTRKTIPGLRLAQKYAVICGGGTNHRIGLFDAILVKENHIAAAGSIGAAVTAARRLNDRVMLEVEVENFEELTQALDAEVDRVLLDNFVLDDM